MEHSVFATYQVGHHRFAVDRHSFGPCIPSVMEPEFVAIKEPATADRSHMAVIFVELAGMAIGFELVVNTIAMEQTTAVPRIVNHEA